MLFGFVSSQQAGGVSHLVDNTCAAAIRVGPLLGQYANYAADFVICRRVPRASAEGVPDERRLVRIGGEISATLLFSRLAGYKAPDRRRRPNLLA